ncbi:MAG: peptidylprolyl isomerase [Endomicrobiaceae bacterium]|nr:peptidylprolyl isomerase [Endomicrobiaceae bacterium]
MKVCKLFVFFICGLFILAGCKEKGEVIAKVGNDKITTEDYSEKVMATPPAYQAYINTESGRIQFVDMLVREKLILESAKQAGINKRDEYKTSISDFKAEQKKQLKDYEDGLLIDMYLKEIQENVITASEDEINKYYEEHKEDFTNPVAIVAKHILVPTREEAEIAIERLNKGESFDKVAQEMSTDKVSAQRGGQIGPFRRGELVKEFEEVVFNLKEGEISEIVETPFGLHIITKVSEEKLPPIPEDIAKAEIKNIIEKTKFEEWFEDAKRKLNVFVDYSKVPTNDSSAVIPEEEQQQEESGLDEFSN